MDGLKNRLVEVETERLGAMNAYAHGAHDFKDAPGSDLGSDHQGEAAFALRNLRFNAFRRKETLLATELEAARWACPEKGRHWKVEAAGPAPGGAAELGIGGRLNAAGKPTAWRLEPGSGSGIRLACGPNAAFLSRAGFLGKNLWCTVYSPEVKGRGTRMFFSKQPHSRPPFIRTNTSFFVVFYHLMVILSPLRCPFLFFFSSACGAVGALPWGRLSEPASAEHARRAPRVDLGPKREPRRRRPRPVAR